MKWKNTSIIIGVATGVYLFMKYLFPVLSPFFIGWFLALIVYPIGEKLSRLTVSKKVHLTRERAGGVVILLNLKNLNDVPLPPSALGQPTLKTKSGNAELMNTNSNSDDSYVNGLDLPLGAGATTSVRYKFNTTVSSTSDAELTIANVTWKGNLQ